MNTQAEIQGRPLMAFRTGAIVVAIVSGFYALAALFMGSPLEFGVALATCGACWVAADFIEWMVEREGAAGRRPPLLSGYESAYPACAGAGERVSRPSHLHFTWMEVPRQRDHGSRMWSACRVAG